MRVVRRYGPAPYSRDDDAHAVSPPCSRPSSTPPRPRGLSRPSPRRSSSPARSTPPSAPALVLHLHLGAPIPIPPPSTTGPGPSGAAIGSTSGSGSTVLGDTFLDGRRGAYAYAPSGGNGLLNCSTGTPVPRPRPRVLRHRHRLRAAAAARVGRVRAVPPAREHPNVHDAVHLVKVRVELDLLLAGSGGSSAGTGGTSSPWLGFFFWRLKRGVGGGEGMGRKDTKPPALSGGGGRSGG
ncbi:hypothetical protein B0H14DRAFT_1493219 [Mycena olivaceomarginata]|nr:hypothetical protein B0H14DRAFT_1493219 [Mycena olivaceomarginata]